MKGPRISKCKILIFGTAAFTMLVIIMILIWFFAIKADIVTRGAVVTSGIACAEIGTSILTKGGSVADAAIAALFCEGVSMPQSMGLGGGFLLTIYDKKTGVVKSLNARETAPSAATAGMFNGSEALSQKGGLAAAVPGELKGYWYLHREYGFLPWKDLVQPTIDLCRNGIYVTEFLARIWLGKRAELYNDPTLREIFIDPATNSTYLEGQYVYRKKLANSLEIIAVEGANALYSANGSLLNGFVKDVQDMGGIITVADMEGYEPVWQDPITANFIDGTTLYTTPLPGSGPILTLILNILDGFLDLGHLYQTQTFQRIIESFKWGYGRRTEMGDDNFVDLQAFVKNLTSKTYAEDIQTKIYDNQTFQNASHYGADTVPVEDHGTANIVVLGPNGDAISVTSTINLYFGAGFASKSTGIILNDEMDDFSSPNVTSAFGLPPSPNNYIEPGKRPLSSMVPSIVIRNKDVVLITGAAGGTKITTSVASVIIKHLWYDVQLQEAVDEKRLHHQLFPMKIDLEEGFETVYPELVQNLTDIGHEIKLTPPSDGFSAVTSITTKNGKIQGAYDIRRGGAVSYAPKFIQH